MPGFGSGPFGAYRFGHYNWPKRVTYDSLPFRHRERDEVEGFPQRMYLSAFEEELDESRTKIREVLDQRDPNKAIASDSAFSVVIDSSSVVDDSFWGTSVLAIVSSGEDISSIGPGWVCSVTSSTDGDDIRIYKVLRIRTRNEPDTRNEILLRGVPEVLLNTTIVLRQPSMLKLLGRDFNVIVDDEEPIQFQRSAVANAVALRGIKSNAQSYSIRGDMAGFNVSALGLWRVEGVPPSDVPSNTVYELPTGSGKFYTTIAPRSIKFDEIPSDVEFDDPDLGTIGILDYDLLFPDASGDNLSPGAAFAENVLEGFFAGEPAEPNTIEVTVVAAIGDPEAESLAVTTVPAFNGVVTGFVFFITESLPIIAGTLVVTTSAGAGSEDFTDNGFGILTGDGGGSGIIDYETGAAVLLYAVAPAGGLTVNAAYNWDALKDFSLPNADRVTADMTEGQRAKIGIFTRGKFILVNDTDESEFYIEIEESYDSGSEVVVFIVSDPSASPALGDYRIKYFPCIELSCGWCRSNVMLIEAEATPELVTGFGGSGTLVGAALSRLEAKLDKLIPVHARLGAFVQKVIVAVSGPTVSVSATIVET